MTVISNYYSRKRTSFECHFSVEPNVSPQCHSYAFGIKRCKCSINCTYDLSLWITVSAEYRTSYIFLWNIHCLLFICRYRKIAQLQRICEITLHSSFSRHIHLYINLLNLWRDMNGYEGLYAKFFWITPTKNNAFYVVF